jgi:hypothetical protein
MTVKAVIILGKNFGSYESYVRKYGTILRKYGTNHMTIGLYLYISRVRNTVTNESGLDEFCIQK